MNPIIIVYLKYIEKLIICNKNNSWNKIKTDNKILFYATGLTNKGFVSNIIVNKILSDSYFNNSSIKNDIIKKIFENKEIARSICDSVNTFLLKVVMDNTIVLDETSKNKIINEANNSPDTKRSSLNENKDIIRHGYGTKDIRYHILCNNQFPLEQRKELVYDFYPDGELQIDLLNELEWKILTTLNFKGIEQETLERLYTLSSDELTKEFDLKDDSIINLLILAKHIKSNIPEESIKSYMRTL